MGRHAEVQLAIAKLAGPSPDVTKHAAMQISHEEVIEQVAGREPPSRREQPSSGFENILAFQQV